MVMTGVTGSHYYNISKENKQKNTSADLFTTLSGAWGRQSESGSSALSISNAI